MAIGKAYPTLLRCYLDNPGFSNHLHLPNFAHALVSSYVIGRFLWIRFSEVVRSPNIDELIWPNSIRTVRVRIQIQLPMGNFYQKLNRNQIDFLVLRLFSNLSTTIECVFCMVHQVLIRMVNLSQWVILSDSSLVSRYLPWSFFNDTNVDLNWLFGCNGETKKIIFFRFRFSIFSHVNNPKQSFIFWRKDIPLKGMPYCRHDLNIEFWKILFRSKLAVLHCTDIR